MSLHLLPLTTLMFFLIFGWKITPTIDLSIISALPVLFYLITNPKDWKKIFLRGFPLIPSLSALLIFCISLFLFFKTSSPQWVLRSLRASISMGTVFIAVIYLKRNFGTQYEFLLRMAMAVAISLHAAFVILTQMSSGLRHATYALTNAHLYVNEMTLLVDNRPLGLTYSLSLTSFLYFAAACLLVTISPASLTGKLLKVAGLAINLVACIWTARTGLVFFPLLLILYLQQYFSTRKINPQSLFIFLLLLSIAAWVAIDNPIEKIRHGERLQEVLTFLTSPSESQFGQQFLTMWHLPDTYSQLFFGNSLTGREEGHYVASDVGYILTIYGIGLVGQFLMLLPVLIGGYASIKLLKTKPDYALLSLIILASYLVLNVKELALLTRTVWPVICVFISISLLEYQDQRKRLRETGNSQQAA